MKVLITGADGQVAHELIRLVNHAKFSIHPFSKTQLDITNEVNVTNTVRAARPDLIINAAAYTRVDRAENDSQVFAVNREGAKHLAQVCEELQIPLIHLSTDYVFNGRKNSPYKETDQAAPINQYGHSKWQGEEAVRQTCSRHIILRVSAVFGVRGDNFVKTIVRLAREKNILRVVADQIICPTPAASIAMALWRLCAALETNPAWGTYHFSGDRAVSWHTFAESILDLYHHQDKITREIIPITTDQYPLPALRPMYSVLDCSELKNIFSIEAADWTLALQHVMSELSAVSTTNKFDRVQQ